MKDSHTYTYNLSKKAFYLPTAMPLDYVANRRLSLMDAVGAAVFVLLHEIIHH